MTRKQPVPFAAPQWPASRVEMWKLNRIIPYDKNPRTHPQEQITALAADMREDGVTAPILVDEKGIIIAGHGRLLAAKENKFEEYPVVVARGWTEQQKTAARIKDNQRALQSGWDNELLRFEVQALKTDGYDIPLLGFDAADLATILQAPTPAANPEEIPPAPAKPIVR